MIFYVLCEHGNATCDQVWPTFDSQETVS